MGAVSGCYPTYGDLSAVTNRHLRAAGVWLLSVVCQQLLTMCVDFSQRLLTYIYVVFVSGCQPIYTGILLAVVDRHMLISWATVYLSMRF